MALAGWRYMPILKWKQGEQLALRNLNDDQWERIVPLIELQPIDAAPDSNSLKAALPAYITKTSDQIQKSLPNGHTLCIDSSYLSPGYPKQVALLVTTIGLLQKNTACKVIPVIHAADSESLAMLPPSHQDFVANQESVVLRLRVDQVEPPQVQAAVKSLTELGIKKRNIHLLVDQYSLLDRQPSDCLNAVKPYLDNAIASNCASVTLAGGSFPINLMGRKQGVTDIPRVEWKVWSLICASDVYQGLRYADYTVTNPAPSPDLDATQMNPSIAIRYTAKDFWRLYKGRGFKSGVPGEYRNLSKLLIADSVFSGAHFSYGDQMYYKAAGGGDKNGNPSSWRKEATNHHMVLTANSL
jgi:hypothetical protein